MSNITKTKPIEVATIVSDLGLAIKVDNFNALLNTPPRKEWFKEYKKIQYLPIDRVKNNLITIFQDYDWSIKEVKVVANSILVYGTLSVVNPITGRTRNLDGVGAVPIQLKSGSNPTDFTQIIGDAIQKNAPAADSFALKNAAAKLGKLFGGGNDEVEFVGMYSKEVPLSEIAASLNGTN